MPLPLEPQMLARPNVKVRRPLPRLQLALVLVGVSLWGLSLAYPALDIGRASANPRGITYLLTGWIGPIGGHFEWYANPLLIIALYLLATGGYGLALGAAALGLALMCPPLLFGTILVNEGGHKAPIQAFLLGYWLWFASGTAILLATVAAFLRQSDHDA